MIRLGSFALMTMVLWVSLTMNSCRESIPSELRVQEALLPHRVDFNFHIKPILSDRCYACHGPDENTREAELRLDQEAAAFGKLASTGRYALVAGDLASSEAWQRIISSDPQLQMPPPQSNLHLSDYEKLLIGRWIEQGAEWKKHWSFVPPHREDAPEDFPAEWKPRNVIDHFIYDELVRRNLEPSREASREQLIRRLSFDLRGLPPTLDEVDAFVADTDPDAYERLIDRMMESEAYAERMTMEWLDVARYADSHGLHADGMREQWPWRDWVIEAFQKNLNYRDFVTWQLAGDLLPEATREQKLATGFHRNHMFNTESGIVSEEFRLQYVADRTNTTATAFMGMTMECAACHDHKFDPISQKEYYQMTAFFNNVPELGMTGTDKNFGPMLLLPDSITEASIAAIDRQLDEVERLQSLAQEEVSKTAKLQEITLTDIGLPTPDHSYPLDRVSKYVNSKGKESLIIDNNVKAYVYGEHEVVDGRRGKGIRIDHDFDGIRLGGVRHFDLHETFSVTCWIKTEKTGKYQSVIGNIGEKNSGWRGWILFLDTLNQPSLRLVNNLSHNLIDVSTDYRVPVNDWVHLAFAYDGSTTAKGAKIYVNGVEMDVDVHWDRLYKTILPTRNRNYTLHPTKPVALGGGVKYLYQDTDDGIFEGAFDQVELYHQCLSGAEVAKVYTEQGGKNQVLTEASKIDHYLKYRSTQHQDQQKKMLDLQSRRSELVNPVQEAMVLEELNTPRATFVLDRGQYDAPAERVYAATPAAIKSLPENAEANRLDLAQWLFSPDHPLTARVAVNRYWQMLFGRGLVSTPHDFGSQGALPSHPHLLDWLACEFQGPLNWDLRKLLKLMLTSATYRQSSQMESRHLAVDAENIFLARGPSHRLSGEMIRDHALAVSGLLSEEVGGPSVKPYMPEGLWEEKNEFSGYLNSYETDTGGAVYRRSMYTFIRRTSPHPAMTTFDVPDRSYCVVKREKTSSPLQSLVLLNDPQFVEAARILAERMQREGGKQTEDQIKHGFRLVCGRTPTIQEAELLTEQFNQAQARFAGNPTDIEGVLEVGNQPFDKAFDPAKTAALAYVANTMLNFDAAYMKR